MSQYFAVCCSVLPKNSVREDYIINIFEYICIDSCVLNTDILGKITNLAPKPLVIGVSIKPGLRLVTMRLGYFLA